MSRQVFANDIEIRTITKFEKNGVMKITPLIQDPDFNPCDCKWVLQRGRMMTADNGYSQFLPYAQNTGSRYEKLMKTLHGEVKKSQSTMVFTLYFPLNKGKKEIAQMFKKETREMQAYVDTQSRTPESK